jgi:hypothetical protein
MPTFSVALSARPKTVTNGIVAFAFYGVAFISNRYGRLDAAPAQASLHRRGGGWGLRARLSSR